MFVKCYIKTILEYPIEFILNTENIIVIEKIMDENKIILNLTGGTFDFRFESLEIADQIYCAFINLLEMDENNYSTNINLIIL